jgi:hypothetical protein
VRLDDRDDATLGAAPRRAQHRGDLHRMVSVVVDDDDPVVDAGAAEATLDAGEVLQALADRVFRDAELGRDGDRGGGIEHVVLPRHR